MLIAPALIAAMIAVITLAAPKIILFTSPCFYSIRLTAPRANLGATILCFYCTTYRFPCTDHFKKTARPFYDISSCFAPIFRHPTVYSQIQVFTIVLLFFGFVEDWRRETLQKVLQTLQRKYWHCHLFLSLYSLSIRTT